MKILEMAAAEGLYNTFVNAVRSAPDVIDILTNEGPWTVFMPTDDAFNHLPQGEIDSILLDADYLTGVLQHHIVSGLFLIDDVKTMGAIDAVDDETLALRVFQGQVRVDEALVVEEDLRADNGVIHGIDLVLIPSNEPSEPRSTMY